MQYYANIDEFFNGRTIKITEAQAKHIKESLSEDVYMNQINNKKKTVNLTYDNDYFKRGNLKNDFLRTDKMQQNNADTYIVPLKNGFKSYNITSINGTEVMHYFKRQIGKDNKKTEVEFKVQDAATNQEHSELFELVMNKNAEFMQFMNDFKMKVGRVVEYHVNEIMRKDPTLQYDTISIYPVPSSSGFNVNMAKLLEETHSTINGMSVLMVTNKIFEKNTKNIQMDTDWINLQGDEFKGKKQFADKDSKSQLTHLQAAENLDSEMKARAKVLAYVDRLNMLCKKLQKDVHDINTGRANVNSMLKINRIAQQYIDYNNTYNELFQAVRHKVYNENGVGRKSIGFSTSKIVADATNEKINMILQPLKYAKMPSAESNTKVIIYYGAHSEIVGNNPEYQSIFGGSRFVNYCQTNLKQNGSIKPLNTLTELDIKQIASNYMGLSIHPWEEVKFEIKKYMDDSRLALRNYFQQVGDGTNEAVQQEIEATKNTIVVIIDDNIAGGATLSDICYQFAKLDIKQLIPITFGQMAKTTYKIGYGKLHEPRGGWNMSKNNQFGLVSENGK